LALVAAPAFAQEAGSLGGTVKDPAGRPMANVQVSVQSPALFQPRTVTTNAAGQWRAPMLPPGSYRVSVSKAEFSSASRAGIRVGLADTVKVDLVLAPVAQAIVEVVDSSSIVDKADAKAGANFSAEAMTVMAVSDRSIMGAVALSPGMSTAGSSTPSVRGSSVLYTNFRVDGTDVKSDYQGNLDTWVIEDNVEDVQVALSGLNVRFGRQGGGSVNVVTKAGGNDFHGSIRAKLYRSDWYSRTQNPVIQPDAGNDTLQRTYDVTVNGPLIKDRLWFSFGTILTPQTSDSRGFAAYTAGASSPVMTGNASMDAALKAGPGNGYAWTPFSSGQTYHYQDKNSYYEGKLTGAVTADHTLEISMQTKNQTYSAYDPYADGNYVIRPEALGEMSWKQLRTSVGYRGVLATDLFLEARVGQMKSQFKSPGGDPAYGGGQLGLYVYAGDGATAGRRRGYGMPFGTGVPDYPEDRDNRTGNINLKFLPEWCGSQEFDVGVDYYDYYRSTATMNGTRNLFFRLGGAYAKGNAFMFPAVNWVDYWVNGQNDNEGLRGPAPSVRQYFGKDGTYKTIQTGVYLNDKWSVNKNWVFSGGFRMDRNQVVDTTGSALVTHNDPTYAFMARWDPTGDSTHLWTLSVANYSNGFLSGFAEQLITSATSKYADRVWTGSPDGAVRFVNFADVTNLSNYGKVINYSDSSKNITYDKNLKPSRVQELSLKYQRSLGEGSHFSATLVERRTLDMYATSQDYAASNVVTIKDPSGAGLPDAQAVQNRIANNPDLKRAYHGLELEWVKKLGASWEMGGSYTYGRAVGNWNDGDSSSGFRDNAPQGLTYERALLERMGRTQSDFAPYGPLLVNQAQKARVYFNALQRPAKDAKLTWSFIVNYDSGTNWSASNQAPFDPAKIPDLTTAFPALVTNSPYWYTQYYGGRGQYEYNDTYSIDMKVSWDVAIPLWKTHFIGDLFVNNLCNARMTSGYNSTFWGADAATQLRVDRPNVFGRQEVHTGANSWEYLGGRYVQGSLGLRF
jgi:hypothetical protein